MQKIPNCKTDFNHANPANANNKKIIPGRVFLHSLSMAAAVVFLGASVLTALPGCKPPAAIIIPAPSGKSESSEVANYLLQLPFTSFLLEPGVVQPLAWSAWQDNMQGEYVEAQSIRAEHLATGNTKVSWSINIDPGLAPEDLLGLLALHNPFTIGASGGRGNWTVTNIKTSGNPSISFAQEAAYGCVSVGNGLNAGEVTFKLIGIGNANWGSSLGPAILQLEDPNGAPIGSPFSVMPGEPFTYVTPSGQTLTLLVYQTMNGVSDNSHWAEMSLQTSIFTMANGSITKDDWFVESIGVSDGRLNYIILTKEYPDQPGQINETGFIQFSFRPVAEGEVVTTNTNKEVTLGEGDSAAIAPGISISVNSIMQNISAGHNPDGSTSVNVSDERVLFDLTENGATRLVELQEGATLYLQNGGVLYVENITETVTTSGEIQAERVTFVLSVPYAAKAGTKKGDSK
ncbi:Uncharacterised protein [Candidatus Gugararchaeum adminiculabundum]|nr:Uncharacterised protein [Candidatus Gugararchaeum adminiculabundum]